MWGKGTGRSLCDNDMLDVMLNTLSASDASTDWSYLYTTIDQCNQVLKYAPGIGMSEDNMNYCLGNAVSSGRTATSGSPACGARLR